MGLGRVPNRLSRFVVGEFGGRVWAEDNQVPALALGRDRPVRGGISIGQVSLGSASGLELPCAPYS